MAMNLPRGNEVDPGAMLPRDNESSCEREVTLAPGQSLPRGSSLSRVHVNSPKCAPLTSFRVKVTNRLKVHFCHFHSSENE